jgi:death-on-curing protein
MLIAPTADLLKRIHDAVILERGEPGYISEGLVDGCIERSLTYIYKFEPFPELFLKVAALLYCIIVFHPFVDGNKRTALWGTAYMLKFNGYLFETLPEDSVEFSKAIAEGNITDISEIAEWLRSHSKKTLYWRLVSWELKTILKAAREYEPFSKMKRVRAITRDVQLIE